MVLLQLKTWPSAVVRKFGAIVSWFKKDKLRIHVLFSVLATFISLLLAVVLAVTLGVSSVEYDAAVQSNSSYQASPEFIQNHSLN
jgi:ABC-type nitrate/sulfonate/bicarbonate transport system permease component